MTGEIFICENCEHRGLAFDETHTKTHTLVRISEKVEEKELSVEERLRLVEDELTKISRLHVEDELAKIRQLLAKLVEKGTGGSPGDPLTKGDLQAAAIEAESAHLEGAPGTENA